MLDQLFYLEPSPSLARADPIAERYELSILMPCLNEAETLACCIRKARAFLMRSGITGEILIADNGSIDGSQRIAETHGARVVPVPGRGYGRALLHGIRAARGRYVIMGDSDDSYDFSRLDAFVEKLRAGYHLVMGNRFLGGIASGAMPPLHRYLGNPVLSALGRWFFQSPCGDFHCGLRGVERDAILALDLQSPGMEFASEMVVKATISRLRIAEVATTLSRDGRSRPPHLRSWRDGWRHLRFLLLFSPRWLFLYPGIALSGVGLAMMLWLLPAPRVVFGVTLDIHTLFYAAIGTVVGFHSMLFWVFAKVYGISQGIAPPDPRFTAVTRRVALEASLVVGGVMLLSGLALGVYAISAWGSVRFGALSPERAMRLVIPSGTMILLAFQIAYGAFFLSMLEIRSARAPGRY
jgi:glycosyltransferase involved in cell wall biosynthesis